MTEKKSTFLLFLFGFIILFLAVFSVLSEAKAANTGTITATVTAQNISISVGTTGVSFGTIGVGTSADTTSAGVNTSITATNDGNITEKFNIKAANSTNWTLAASPSSDTYAMNFCTTNCDATPSWSAVGIDPSYAVLAASVASSGNSTFDVQIKAPTSTTFFTQQSISITVQATTP